MFDLIPLEIHIGRLFQFGQKLLQGNSVFEIQIISATAQGRIGEEESYIVPSAEAGGDLFHGLSGELQFPLAPSGDAIGVDDDMLYFTDPGVHL